MKKTYEDGVLEGYSRCLQDVYRAIDRANDSAEIGEDWADFSKRVVAEVAGLTLRQQVPLAQASFDARRENEVTK